MSASFGILYRDGKAQRQPDIQDAKRVETMLVMIRLADLQERIQVVWSGYTYTGNVSKRPWEARLFDYNRNTHYRRYASVDAFCDFLQEFVQDPDRFTEHSKDETVCHA